MNNEDGVLDITSMRQYVVLGQDVDGKPVYVTSPNITLEEMGGYIGRLQASMAFQTARAAIAVTMRHPVEASPPPLIVVPKTVAREQ